MLYALVNNMVISIASDHGGYELKNQLIDFLKESNFEVIDCGTNSIESCDYPLFAQKVCESILNKESDKGILICTSGEGIMISANKFKGIRCGIGYNDEVSSLIVKHNNCNVISFGAKFMSVEDCKRRVMIFLNEKFEGGRHQRRVDEISSFEK